MALNTFSVIIIQGIYENALRKAINGLSIVLFHEVRVLAIVYVVVPIVD